MADDTPIPQPRKPKPNGSHNTTTLEKAAPWIQLVGTPVFVGGVLVAMVQLGFIGKSAEDRAAALEARLTRLEVSVAQYDTLHRRVTEQSLAVASETRQREGFEQEFERWVSDLRYQNRELQVPTFRRSR
jgi:hypothetical protein